MNKLQSKLMETMSFFHSFCEKNGLFYIVAYGTFLGAVRHSGFIPWDDDLDVCMPRPDYERLIDLMADYKGRFRMETPRINSGVFYYPMGKLYDTSTTAIEKTKFNEKKGIYIDIFPLDGLGCSDSKRNRLFRKISFYNMVISSRVSVVRKGRSVLKNLSIRFSSLFPESVFNTSRMIRKLDRECANLPYESSIFVGVLMGTDGINDFFPKSWLENPELYGFESIKVYGPKNYDDYLTNKYGDWRKLPPKEKQKSNHDFLLLDLEHGYLEK